MRHLMLILTLAASGALTGHGAGLRTPLHIGTTNAVRDEAGAPLVGTDPAAALFGHPVVTGDLVQVIKSLNGSVDAPAIDGSIAGTNNILVATTRIGQGVDPAAGAIGQFGLTLPDYDDSALFVRVFNAPSLAAASFYANSQVYAPTALTYSVFVPQLAAVQPLDTGDTDGDALNNSWEKSLGSNPAAQDSDGDGIGDNAEFRSGTSATDPASYLRMVRTLPNLAGDNLVFWDSVPGKTYQVEATTNDLAGAQAFVAVGGPVTATATLSQITHTNGLAAPRVNYRIRLVEP